MSLRASEEGGGSKNNAGRMRAYSGIGLGKNRV
jgi:hypothetical protein